MSSLYDFSSNPIEKVFSLDADVCAADATTIDESSPPLKKKPSGTSLISREETAMSVRRRVSNIASSVDIEVSDVLFSSQ